MEEPQPPPQQAPHRPLRLVLVGGVIALSAGLGIAWLLTSGDRPDPGPPPAAEGGLVIDTTAAEDPRIDTAKPLRCFVGGQFVGELTLADCARRNGVATDALDVGLDETGALAASETAGPMLTPLPPLEAPVEAAPIEPESALPPADDGASTYARCLRYGGGRWREAAADLDLDSCVQALFAGRCARAGEASYGRHGERTLRLVPGRVEISDDNRSFRTLAPQGPDCAIPPL
ncbi:hypothetical protein [Phenylobacterium sp.]|jgi:hypothetical protein|uniref:hypothetical protein n=1 Tax=Phenylobacterium sp. TaxID=1871053 RepID=UPI0037C9630C